MTRRVALALVATLVLLVGVPTAGAQEPTTPEPPDPPPSSDTTVPPSTDTTTPPSTESTTTSTTTDTTVPEDTTTTTLPPLVPPSTITSDQLSQLGSLEAAYEEASAEELELIRRYLDAMQQASSLGLQVEQLNLSLLDIQTQLVTAEGEVRARLDELDRAEDDLEDAEARLDAEEQRLREQAVQAYIGGGLAADDSADALLRAEDIDRFGTTRAYADAVVSDTRNTIQRVRELRREVQELEARSDQAYQSALAARDTVSAQEAALRGQRDEQSRLQTAVADAALAQQSVIDEVSRQRASFAERIAGLRRTSDNINAVLGTRQAGQALPLLTAGMFVNPLPSGKLTSNFGPRSDPFFGIPRMHNGVDIAAPSGTPIRAGGDGVVVLASDQGGYGLCTVIDHGSGLGTLYGHQSVLGVKVGDVVTKGQVIGFVGSTGRSTGPHVHWEVRQFGQPVDPLPYLGPG